MTITLFFNAKHLVSVEIFLEKKGQQISVPECLSSICVMQQQKIPHTGNTRPSCTCVIQEYRYYTMSLSQYHGCCQYHKSMSIPWVFANYKSHCPYHESRNLNYRNTTTKITQITEIKFTEIQFSEVQKYAVGAGPSEKSAHYQRY